MSINDSDNVTLCRTRTMTGRGVRGYGQLAFHRQASSFYNFLLRIDSFCSYVLMTWVTEPSNPPPPPPFWTDSQSWKHYLPHNLWMRAVKNTQDSSPAWTRETYHPPRGKCSLCCFIAGVFTPGQDWGTPPPKPGLGCLPPARTGVPPSPWLGYPHGQDWGASLARTGVPPERTWGQWPGKEPGAGVPPPLRVWTDRHLWKQYLPHPWDACGNESKFRRNRWNRQISKTVDVIDVLQLFYGSV